MDSGKPISPYQVQQLVNSRDELLIPSYVINKVNELIVQSWRVGYSSCTINDRVFLKHFRNLITEGEVPDSWLNDIPRVFADLWNVHRHWPMDDDDPPASLTFSIKS